MFTQKDIELIKIAKAEGGKIWDNDEIKPIKDKIKAYYRGLDNCCCYCRRVFEGEFKLDIDIEHVLPKSKKEFRHHMFNPLNLNIACKRCNLEKKGSDISFITSIENINNQPFSSQYYKFIHPNLDNYSQNIKHIVHIEDNNKFVKYMVLTDSKGKFTYDYFDLKSLEINQLNEVQGVHETKICSDFSDEMIIEISNLFKS